MAQFGSILLLTCILQISAFSTFERAGFRISFKSGHQTFPIQATMEDNTVQTSITPDMRAYSAGYSTVFEELPFQKCEPTVGNIPEDLVGTYFRSGPAMFSAGSILPPKKSIVQPKQPPVPDGQDKDRMVKHPFDGDGAILGVTFSGDGKATARFRYVRTIAMTNERKKGKKLYSGMETTRMEGYKAGSGQGNDFPVPMFKHHLQPGLNKSRKNLSNTRSVYWSKKLLTLWEGGLPYKLDALGLSTEGKSQLGGVLDETDSFSGKALYDPVKDRMLFYSNKQDAGSSELTVYEFNSKFRVASASVYKLPGFAMLSDFVATEKYTLFVQSPVSTNGMQFMLSKDPSKTLKLEKGPAMLHILKRGESDSMKTINIPVDDISDADLHFCNAHETEDGMILFDAIRSDSSNVKKSFTEWPWATSLTDFAASASKKSLWRYTVNISNGSIEKECIADIPIYFATVNPKFNTKTHQFVYAAVGTQGHEVAPPQGIAKIDINTKIVQTWFPKEYEFCGEPMFASKKSNSISNIEDDGYIISVLFNGKEKMSEIIILNATKVQDGPIARIPLGLAVPHGLYGCFADTSECNWSAEEIERRAKLADKMESRGNMWNEVKSDFSGLGLRLDDFEEYFGDIL